MGEAVPLLRPSCQDVGPRHTTCSRAPSGAKRRRVWGRGWRRPQAQATGNSIYFSRGQQTFKTLLGSERDPGTGVGRFRAGHRHGQNGVLAQSLVAPGTH